jgi:hypothetical protein
MPLYTFSKLCKNVYMPLYTFLHNLLNVLVQIANKMGLQKKMLKEVKQFV